MGRLPSPQGPAEKALPSPESPGRHAARHRLNLDGVLCLWDDRTDSYAELAARPSIPLRVCIHGPSDGPWSALPDLRVLLVADVLTRIAELNGLQVIAVLAAASLPPRRVRPERQRAWHPPTRRLRQPGGSGSIARRVSPCARGQEHGRARRSRQWNAHRRRSSRGPGAGGRRAAAAARMAMVAVLLAVAVIGLRARGTFSHQASPPLAAAGGGSSPASSRSPKERGYLVALPVRGQSANRSRRLPTSLRAKPARARTPRRPTGPSRWTASAKSLSVRPGSRRRAKPIICCTL